MGDDAERAEDEYWAEWGQHNLRDRARRIREDAEERPQEEDWSEGGLVQRFPEGLTPSEIAERMTASLVRHPIAPPVLWEMTPEQRAGFVSARLVAHRTKTNATWSIGTTSPQEGRGMFAGDPDWYGPRDAGLERGHAHARAVEQARREREAIEEAHKAKEANWRRAKIAARLREIMEGIETDQEPDVSMDELEALGDYVTKRLTELKRLAQIPLEPDVTSDGPCVVTFSRSYNSGRTSYTYVALRIPNGPSAGMWTTTGHRVRNFLTWNELMEFAAGGVPDRPVVVQVVSGWTLL